MRSLPPPSLLDVTGYGKSCQLSLVDLSTVCDFSSKKDDHTVQISEAVLDKGLW